MAEAPFLVKRSGFHADRWSLYMRGPILTHKGYFDTQRQAIDYAYKHWPWWP